MTKKEFIDAVQEKSETGLSKREVEKVVTAAFDQVVAATKLEKRFGFPGFGIFSLKERAARDGRNPATGAPIKIAASKTINFKLSSKVKEIL